MCSHPLVSVIIPTCNRAALAPEAVASVLAQSWRDFEVLVVDDASTDATAAALAPFGARIRLWRRECRGGVSAARNTGIKAARGEWLAFLDSDDLWLPEKLARQLDYLAAHRDLLLCQTEETWVRRGVRVNQPRTHRKIGGRIFSASLERCMISPSAVILHRRLFDRHGAFDEDLPAAEDYDLWLRLTWRYAVGLVPEPLIIKRGGRPDQLSAQWGLDRYRIRALTKLLEEPELPAPEALAARRVLARKCAIYAQGCEKRHKGEEARFYRDLGRRLAAGAEPRQTAQAGPVPPTLAGKVSCQLLSGSPTIS
jgi:glycosyltransferase involved in cell wall biosynthesis